MCYIYARVLMHGSLCVIGFLNFLYGPGFLDITYMMAYLILD